MPGKFTEALHPRSHGRFAHVASGDVAAKKAAVKRVVRPPADPAAAVARINHLEAKLAAFPERGDMYRPTTDAEKVEFKAKGATRRQLYDLKQAHPNAVNAIRDAKAKAAAQGRFDRGHLSPDEMHVVRVYLGLEGAEDSGSVAFNKDMRQFPDRLNPEFAHMRDQLDAAMTKHPLDQQTDVQRMVVSKGSRDEILSHANDPNYRYSDPTFMSTAVTGNSTTAELAQAYGRHAGPEAKILLEMTLPKGMPSVNVAHIYKGEKFAEEGEILLPRDLKWKVVSVGESDVPGIPLVKMELAADEKFRPRYIRGLNVWTVADDKGSDALDAGGHAKRFKTEAGAQRHADQVNGGGGTTGRATVRNVGGQRSMGWMSR